MLKNSKILWISLIALGACTHNPPQYPSQYKKGGFMEYSKQFNRDLKNLENQYFEAYMQAHPSQEFVNTQSGFKMTKTQLGEKNTQDNDTIVYTYVIKDLQDSVLYSASEIGKKKQVMGKAEMLIGIEYALKRMNAGEKATLLLPSSLAYGANGDGNKIGANEPLVIELELIENKNK
ncbi:FKBP-type peptidyl-prolyl cis-trans isomerase [Ornithobacterium rhinotracheale]